MGGGKRHALGQHFLRDADVIGRIVAATEAELARTGARNLVEIGPGRGALTLPLAVRLGAGASTPAKVARWTIMEKDRQLAAQWRALFASEREWEGWRGKLSLIAGDFLDVPESEWLAEPAPGGDAGSTGVVSNLPYSAGTAILLRLIERADRIPFLVLMFQAEVARRLYAEPDGEHWGSLSLWVQARWSAERLLVAKPGAFSPPPKVDSEVVILRPLERPRVPGLEDPAVLALWDQLLRAAFAQRRKMLRSGALRGEPRWQIALDRAGVDGTRRAEALGWDDWARILAAARPLFPSS